MTENLVGGVLSMWRDAAAYFRDRHRCAYIARRLDALGAEECHHLLGEYGLTRDQFDVAMRIPFASEDLTSAALRSVNLDPEEFHREQDERSRAMRGTCMMCRAKYRCRRDAASGRFKDNYLQYCPNQATIASLITAA